MASLQTTAPLASGDDEIDLKDLGSTLTRQWGFIARVTIIATVLAFLYLLVAKPQFAIDGSLYLGDAQGSAGGAGQDLSQGLGFLAAFQSVSDVETQVELIQAKALLEQAILETGLNSPILPAGAAHLRYWNWAFLDGKAIDAYAPRPGDVVALFATLAEPEAKVQVFDVKFGDGGRYQIFRPGGLYGTDGTVLTGVLGQPASGGGLSLLIKPVIDGMPPASGSRYVLKVQPAAAVEERLLKAGLLSVAAGGTVTQPTKLANIEFTWSNPYQGRDFINQLMSDFIATQLSWKTQSASATEAFISTQLDNIRNSLSSADQNLARYQSETGILDVPENAKAVIGQLSQYEVQRTTLTLQQEALQQLANDIARPGTNLNPYLVSQTGDLVLGSLATTLANAQTQLEAQRVQFTGNATEIQVQQATVNKVEDAIRTLVGNDLSLANTSLQNIDRLIDGYENQLKGLPGQSLQVVELTRSSDVFGQLYVLLEEKEEEAEVSKAATIINTRVVTPAEVPLEASKPNAGTTVLIGFFVGLFGSVGFVLARRAISGRFQSDDEIRRAVALPVYGLVPRRPRGESARHIFTDRPQSPFAEAFRLLRSNLYQSASTDRLRVIVVCSASSGDGKTTVATNLAKILADDGKRVVLVDADLHRGRVHTALNIAQAPGLAEWLVTGKRPALQTVAGQRFTVLTAGVFPPNPSELINEGRLSEIFETLRGEMEFVVVDSPPLPAVSDTMTIGLFADLLLSVVHIGHTLRRGFQIHIETVGKLEARHGLVINSVIGSAYGYGYGYGYGYAKSRGEAPPSWLGRLFGRR